MAAVIRNIIPRAIRRNWSGYARGQSFQSVNCKGDTGHRGRSARIWKFWTGKSVEKVFLNVLYVMFEQGIQRAKH